MLQARTLIADFSLSITRVWFDQPTSIYAFLLLVSDLIFLKKLVTLDVLFFPVFIPQSSVMLQF